MRIRIHSMFDLKMLHNSNDCHGIEIRTYSFEYAEELVNLNYIKFLDKQVVPGGLVQFFFSSDKRGFGMTISVCDEHILILKDER